MSLKLQTQYFDIADQSRPEQTSVDVIFIWVTVRASELYQYYTFLPRWRLILNKPGFLLWIYNCVIESDAEVVMGGDDTPR